MPDTRAQPVGAISAVERERLLSGNGSLCVRYSMLLPAAAAMLLASTGARPQDAAEETDAAQMDTVEVTGGDVRGGGIRFCRARS